MIYFAEFIFAIDHVMVNFAEFNFAKWGQNRKNKFRKNFFRKKFLPLTLFRMGYYMYVKHMGGGKKYPPGYLLNQSC